MKKRLAKAAALLAAMMFMTLGTVANAAESANIQQLAVFGANYNTPDYEFIEYSQEELSKSPDENKTFGELEAGYKEKKEKEKDIRLAIRFGKYIVFAAIAAVIGKIRVGKRPKGDKFGDDISDFSDFT